MSAYRSNITYHIAQLVLGLHIAGGLIYFAISYYQTGFLDFSLLFLYIKRWTNSFSIYSFVYAIQMICIFEYVNHIRTNIDKMKVDIVSLTPFIFFFASIIFQTTYILLKVILL